MADHDKLKKAKELYEVEGLSFREIGKILHTDRNDLSEYAKANNWQQNIVEPSVNFRPLVHIKTGKNYKEDIENGTAQIETTSATEPKSAEEIIALLKLDITKWKLSSYWNKEKSDGTWFISALVTRLSVKEELSDKFIEFLTSYKYTHAKVAKPKLTRDPSACLIFNKQDAHLNKYDINGHNNIQVRFNTILDKVKRILKRATATNNIKKSIYILGSDLIDSEWTEMTTKGTPQKSILPYHKGFELICNHEIEIINVLLENVQHLEVLFVPGNHDQYVGWHVVNWLKVFYKDQKNLIIDIAPSNTKYVQFSNSAIMFNHGDGMKPEKLAQVFPLEFKAGWSSCNNHYIFTGDKHHELSRDIGGIRFYQIPALSKAVSAWDSKHGWTMSKAEMTAFLITEEVGLTDIYKEQI